MASSYRTQPSGSDGSDAPTVLIVEDEPAIAEAVREALADVGITAGICPLGWSAQLCIRQQQPKVVILDIQMPNVDGIQLFYLLRGDPKTSHIPVIFLTANPNKVRHELPNFNEMRAALLPKPFNVVELLDLVEKILSQKS